MIDFDEMIENHLKKNPWKKEIGRYYPSEIGGCLRKVWYSYKEPQEPDPELSKIFELGNILHDFIVDVLRSEKNPDVELLSNETPIRVEIDDFVVSGRIDDVILLKSKGQTYLVEVKSTANTDYVKDLNPQYVGQLMFYMHASNIHKGILLYVDKKNLKTKAFEIDYDEGEAQRIIDRFRRLHKSLVDNVPPEPEAKQDPRKAWMCNYCPYAEKCRK